MPTQYARATGSWLALVIGVAFTCLAPVAQAVEWNEAIEAFGAHYEARLGDIAIERTPLAGGQAIALSSPRLKGPGNQPVLLLHDDRRPDVVILIHGLSDSPYYMRAIADDFYEAGANVVLPLLPAHGLIDPDKAMEDGELASKWMATATHSVEVAQRLGDRVSMGGFSTGGALSVLEGLRSPERVDGGLFLFSAALSVGTLNEWAGNSLVLLPKIAKSKDGEYKGVGPNPYKYPRFTQYGGLQLTKIIEEIDALLDEGGPSQPVFAVHSIHDAAAMPKGVGKLLRAEGTRGVAIVVASNPPMAHGSVVLERDVELLSGPDGVVPMPPSVPANPSFSGMMSLALTFFERLPQHIENR